MEREPLQARGDPPAAAPTRVLMMLRLGPSPRVGLSLVAMHLGAIACLVPLPLPGSWLGGVGLVVVLNLVRAYRLHAARTAGASVVGLTALADGRWRLETCGGRLVEAWTVSPPCVFRTLVTLRFRDRGGCSWPVVVLPDMLDREAFRRLRVLLRVRAAPAGAQAPRSRTDKDG